jgi:4-amino-4-deoxy-L-arabinose transferase-like glycosyltransferase
LAAANARSDVLFDWIAPAVLAAVVLIQVAPSMNRPLVGDELENYQKHLTLPFKRVLTTMEGANNQLGFTLLSWTSMRIFGDSPASVRLPALLGGMLLPAVAYLLGRRTFGRAAAIALGAALALWPDCTLAAMQGRSYSLLMLVSVIHVYYFRRFVTSPDHTSGLVYAATLTAACMLHLWFVLVVGAELLFLCLRRIPLFGGKSPLAVETFLVAITLGGLGAVAIQAGILPKFVYVLTQKNPTPVDAQRVLKCIAQCHLGVSFDNDQVDAFYRVSWTNDVLRTAIDLLTLVGVVACCWSARRSEAARFQIGSYLVVAATFFLVVYIQKPVYIYSRFFVYLPISLFWTAAYGWSELLSRQPATASAEREGFVPGLKRGAKVEASTRISTRG